MQIVGHPDQSETVVPERRCSIGFIAVGCLGRRKILSIIVQNVNDMSEEFIYRYF